METMTLSNEEIENAILEVSEEIQKEMETNKEKSLPYPEIRDASESKAIQLIKTKIHEILSPTDILNVTTLIYDGVVERMEKKLRMEIQNERKKYYAT